MTTPSPSRSGPSRYAARVVVLWCRWTALLVASLVAVVVLSRQAAGASAGAGGSTGGATSDLTGVGDTGPRHGFQLVESAGRVGIDFVHQAPRFDARLEHIMPQVAAMGASVAI